MRVIKNPCGFVLNFSFVLILSTATLFSIPTRADDTDPFQFENHHWMSFDNYKDRVKRGLAVDTPASPATSKESESDVTSKDVATPAAADAESSSTPVVAQPTRPIDLPVLPGINKGFSVKVDSTQDDKPPIAQITNLNDKPRIKLPESNWQSAAEAARHSKSEDSDEHLPLDVRFSLLPNREITPALEPERKSYQARMAAKAAAAPSILNNSEKKTDLASCQAVDAYKKHQLEAIQSDRQTLANLQTAIAQLGLQKQLSFLTGATGSVAQSATPANMDIPVDAPSIIKTH